ncbi:MAG: hypothetical protein KDE56_05025 [Anaerolineales bacterium]|nr:hypothetical protein [Anaerolineales bacterium]
MIRRAVVHGLVGGLLLSLAGLYPAIALFSPLFLPNWTRPVPNELLHGLFLMVSAVVGMPVLLGLGIFAASRTRAHSWRQGAKAGVLAGLVAGAICYLALVSPLNALAAYGRILPLQPGPVPPLPSLPALTRYIRLFEQGEWLLSGTLLLFALLGTIQGAYWGWRKQQPAVDKPRTLYRVVIDKEKHPRDWFRDKETAARAGLLVGCGVALLIFVTLTGQLYAGIAQNWPELAAPIRESNANLMIDMPDRRLLPLLDPLLALILPTFGALVVLLTPNPPDRFRARIRGTILAANIMFTAFLAFALRIVYFNVGLAPFWVLRQFEQDPRGTALLMQQMQRILENPVAMIGTVLLTPWVLLLLLLLVGLWFGRRGWEKTAVLLAFLVPLLFYTLVVIDPRTHIYTFFPAASILAALGAEFLFKLGDDRRPTTDDGWNGSDGVRVRPRSSASYLQTAVFALFIAISTLYVILMFVDVTPERQRTWAENRPTFYPTTWDEPPLYGVFGFPHQAGWRAVASLPLPWPYGSNEEEEVTQFYLADAPHTYCNNAETFILAQQVQDEMPYDGAVVAGLHQRYEVTVNGRSSLKIYTRQPADQIETIEAAGLTQWRTPQEMVGGGGGGETAVSHPLSLVLGNQQVRFLGYDIDPANAYPGGSLTVVLYWEALAPFAQNYQTFTQLLQDGTLYAQHDGAPECNITPTTHWEPGQIIADPHIIPLAAEIPAGSYTLVTGMYNLLTQERLPVPDMEHNLIVLDSVALTEKPNTIESNGIAKP